MRKLAAPCAPSLTIGPTTIGKGTNKRGSAGAEAGDQPRASGVGGCQREPTERGWPWRGLSGPCAGQELELSSGRRRRRRLRA